jgi:ABC-2 type transport system permease protein
MNNIWIVTSREYSSRVKKKSFILMTLLAPLLIAAFYGAIIWMSINDNVGSSTKNIVVVDPVNVFTGKLKNPDKINFILKPTFNIKELVQDESIDGFIEIPQRYKLADEFQLKYQSMKSLSVSDNDKIKDAFGSILREEKLKSLGITQAAIDSLRVNVNISEFKIDDEGNSKSSNLGINTALGMGLAVMIYFFIFLYGVQVMRGVIEEKTNRIVELIVSTVKPFQLMMGKVIGIAAVGLTQLGIWMILTSILMTIISVVFGLNVADASQVSEMASNPALKNMDNNVAQALTSFYNLPLLKIFGTFVFYFIGGYLLYGALFAAIGSAVDSETDTQQFMMPITLPLVFSFVISFSVVVNDPNGVLATWLSIIPFSSPIVMMVRTPFEPELWQVITSMLVLLATIIGIIWLAGKIYRTGILMYGKKPTYKELAKWLFYKN